MTSWIRWSGLAVFSLLTTLLILIWLLLLPWLLEWGIESSGEKVFGAKVEVGNVDLAFSPLGFSVFDVQVADRDQPMRNLFSIDAVDAQTELFPLLMSKVIVPEMRVQGMRLGTARQYSGALDDTKQAGSKQSAETGGSRDSTVPEVSAELPGVDELLAREPLRTVAAGKEFEASYRQTKARIEASISQLPDEKKLKRLEQEVKALSEGKIKNLSDFQKKKEEFDRLKGKVKTLRKEVSHARKTVSEGVETLRSQYQVLRDAPEEDLARLRERYGFDGVGAVNVLGLLAGGETGDMARQALEYYQYIDGFLSGDENSADDESTQARDEQNAEQQRAAGRFIHFDSDTPLPDIWIKNLELDLALAEPNDTKAGQLHYLEMQIADISHQQALTGKPLSFQARMRADQKLGEQRLEASGSFDRRGSSAYDSLQLSLHAWPLSDVDLGSGSLKLTAAEAEVDLKAHVLNAQLDVNSIASITNARFGGGGEGKTQATLLSVLQKMKAFELQLFAQGEVQSPDLRISSDLDKRIKAAFKAELSEQAAGYEGELKQKLQARMGQYAGDYSQYVERLSLTEGTLEDQSGMLEGLLEQQMASYKNELENKAKSKAGDALKDQLNKLF